MSRRSLRWAPPETTGTISNTGPLYTGAEDGGGQDQYTGLLDSASVTEG